MRTLILLGTLFLGPGHAFEEHEVDWSSQFRLPPGTNRANLYRLNPSEFAKTLRAGKLHALFYPVEVSGLFVPYAPLQYFFRSDQQNPLRRWVIDQTRGRMPFQNERGMYDWLGLTEYPQSQTDRGPYQIPFKEGRRPELPMGVTLIETQNGEGLTFSCATCHATQLFGRPILGLTNRRPRANRFFHMAKQSVPKLPSKIFQRGTEATDGERRMFERTQKNLRAVGAKDPAALGLDTSLAQVALGLARRKDDAYASKDRFRERFPRRNPLKHFVADSKPAVWWNLKYKTRWLSDGSIVSGNPIFTNFLWNEIGRGTDLHELEKWMQRNQKTIKELTAAVFATEAPRWTDFFPAQSINLAQAKRGERVFQKACQRCHGEYQKAWSNPEASDPLATTRVIYHEQTPVMKVGTDPQRYEGMQHFAEQLNKLQISRWMKTVVQPQEGYVPPPLVSVWARFPYFHNGSVPNLCELFTPPQKRVQSFYQGRVVDSERDFDSECVGYPTGSNIPEQWKREKEARYDTRRKGLRNSGHYRMWLDEQGRERYSAADKRDLIAFLKTL